MSPQHYKSFGNLVLPQSTPAEFGEVLTEKRFNSCSPGTAHQGCATPPGDKGCSATDRSHNSMSHVLGPQYLPVLSGKGVSSSAHPGINPTPCLFLTSCFPRSGSRFPTTKDAQRKWSTKPGLPLLMSWVASISQ